MDEFNHVCKLCNKSYPSGKSLGGHMRSHVMAERKKKLLSSNKKIVVNFTHRNVEGGDDEEDEEDGDDDENEGIDNDQFGNGGKYGLRENPKKTWRIQQQRYLSASKAAAHHHHHAHANNEVRVCKQCGKGFNSLKALCGHMSIHSNKDKYFKEEDDISWSSDSKEQMFLSMESDDNNSKPQTRSSLTKYNNNNNNNGGSSSSNHSEIDQLDPEEVALCLMMLSRDTSGISKACFDLGVESSDNNSVILEGGSSKNVVVAAKRPKVDDYNPDYNYNYDYSSKKIKYDNNSQKVGINKSLGGSTTTAKKGSTSKKVKGHKCPYCPKMFKSGQALGGHKRSHMMGSNRIVLHSEGRLDYVPEPVASPEPEIRQPMIDLNLPAPIEEEVSGNSQFVTW